MLIKVVNKALIVIKSDNPSCQTNVVSTNHPKVIQLLKRCWKPMKGSTAWPLENRGRLKLASRGLSDPQLFEKNHFSPYISDNSQLDPFAMSLGFFLVTFLQQDPF
jgi:hypothetical protein